jgi:uncharacterized membrane protein YeaQ/YmgE (transglycosylase-associated protein family)
MGETAQQVIVDAQQNPVLALALAFVAGFAANKSVAHEGRTNFILHLIVGIVGHFVGQFALRDFDLLQYLEGVPQFRFLFDLIAAYLCSFVVATIIHFIKPN